MGRKDSSRRRKAGAYDEPRRIRVHVDGEPPRWVAVPAAARTVREVYESVLATGAGGRARGGAVAHDVLLDGCHLPLDQPHSIIRDGEVLTLRPRKVRVKRQKKETRECSAVAAAVPVAAPPAAPPSVATVVPVAAPAAAPLSASGSPSSSSSGLPQKTPTPTSSPSPASSSSSSSSSSAASSSSSSSSSSASFPSPSSACPPSLNLPPASIAPVPSPSDNAEQHQEEAKSADEDDAKVGGSCVHEQASPAPAGSHVGDGLEEPGATDGQAPMDEVENDAKVLDTADPHAAMGPGDDVADVPETAGVNGRKRKYRSRSTASRRRARRRLENHRELSDSLAEADAVEEGEMAAAGSAEKSELNADGTEAGRGNTAPALASAREVESHPTPQAVVIDPAAVKSGTVARYLQRLEKSGGDDNGNDLRGDAPGRMGVRYMSTMEYLRSESGRKLKNGARRFLNEAQTNESLIISQPHEAAVLESHTDVRTTTVHATKTLESREMDRQPQRAEASGTDTPKQNQNDSKTASADPGLADKEVVVEQDGKLQDTENKALLTEPLLDRELQQAFVVTDLPVVDCPAVLVQSAGNELSTTHLTVRKETKISLESRRQLIRHLAEFTFLSSELLSKRAPQ